jgi:ABC-type amino acid transport substrate-binding protein
MTLRGALAVLAFSGAPVAAHAEAAPLRIGIEAEGAQAAHIEHHFGGDACPGPSDYRFSNPARPTRIEAELVLLCNALDRGGYRAPRIFAYAYNYNRGLTETVAGRLDMPTQSVWAEEIEAHGDALLASAPVIDRGEWIVGLYTAATRADVMAVRTPEALRGLVAAAPRGWVEDWRALTALGLRGLIDVQENERIPAMIAAGHADFTLVQFGAGVDMGHTYGQPPVRMLPIPGLKLGFDTSRHFAVSRARPDAAALKAALDAGIAAMRADGTLDVILGRVGLREPRVADWVAVGRSD